MKHKFDCPRTCPFFERVDLCKFNPVFAALGNTVVNSHVVSVNVEITNLEALAKAAKYCGLEMSQAETYKWYGRHVGDYPLPKGFTRDELGKCQYKLSIPGAHPGQYEIGIAEKNGSYVPLFDFWGNGANLQKHVGKNGEKLVDRYALECAMGAAEAESWQVEDHGETATVFHPTGGVLEIREGGEIEASEFIGSGCHDASQILIGAMGTEDEFNPKPEYYDSPAFESDF